MNQKMITLCSATMAIARSMRNFSKWIRTELKAYDEGEDRLYWMGKAKAYERTIDNIREHGMYWDEEGKTWRFP